MNTLLDVDLNDRVDRVGNGRLRITGYCFRNSNRDILKCVKAGEDLFFHIKYESEVPLQDVNIAFNLYEYEGQVLMNFNTEDQGQGFSFLPAKGEIVCRIPSLPLRGGFYTGNLYCTVQGEISDWIKPAIRLVVEDQDIFGTGKLVGQGKFIAPHFWEVRA